MKICTLASGSKGNSTYIRTSKYHILIDLGRNKKYLKEKLAEINVDYNDIDYVLLTHSHKDHTSALKTFLKGHKAKLVLTKEMFQELDDINDLHILIYEDSPNIDGITIKTFKLSHDAADCRGFLITENNSSLVYITDTGYINTKYLRDMRGKNTYLIESNHDIEMLKHGPYPLWLQQRVLSDVGHLSNRFTGIYLSKLINEQTHNIILLHLSEKNNSEECALETINDSLKDIDTSNIKIRCAKQNEIGELLEI